MYSNTFNIISSDPNKNILRFENEPLFYQDQEVPLKWSQAHQWKYWGWLVGWGPQVVVEH